MVLGLRVWGQGLTIMSLRTKPLTPTSLKQKKCRTVVKEDKGLRPGKVENLTAFPAGPSSILTKEEVLEIAHPILSRRTHLNYDTYDRFRSDTTSLAFVEHVPDAAGNVRYECSCLVGSKGSKRCVHVGSPECTDP